MPTDQEDVAGPGTEDDITAFRQRIAELTQEVERYRNIVNQFPSGVYVYRLEDLDDDRTLRMIAANPAVEALTGVSPQQIIGRTLDENFPGLREQGIPQAYAQVIHCGEPFTTEVVYGDDRVITSAFAVRVARVGPDCVAVTFDNITQQKRIELELAHLNDELAQRVREQVRELHRANAELEQRVAERTAELQERTEQLSLVLDATNDGVWDWHIPTGAITFSARWQTMLGYASGELPGTLSTWQNLLHPDDQPRILALVADYLQAEHGAYEAEFRMRTKVGTWVWILARGKVVERDAQGQPIRMVGIHTDITIRKQAEEELRTFQTVVENTPDGVSLVSPEGIITYGNPAMKAMLGYGDDYLGHPIAIVFGGDTVKTSQIIHHVLNAGAWQGMETFFRKDGTVFNIHLSVFAIRDATGAVVAFPGIVRDLSEIQRGEAERARLQQQIIETQQTSLRELASPLIPLTDNLVLLPLIGTIDSTRAQMFMETLLTGIAERQADFAIVDITGVHVVDTQVAQALIRTAQAVKLLGARVILTGIQPQIAMILIQLGADLNDIVTFSSLQSGIAYVLQTV